MAHRQLDLPVLVEQDVRGLQVVVDDPVRWAVDVGQTRTDLTRDGPRFLLGQHLHACAGANYPHDAPGSAACRCGVA